MAALLAKIKSLPQKPGVYLFKDRSGEVLYVGKAKNLRHRVKSYFRNNHVLEPRLALMLKEMADLDYIIVSTEIESLMLENNLIKQYKPRFNIRLRDDKNYQFIKVDYGMEIPQVYPVRRIEPDARNLKSKISNLKSKYFGPYTSALAVKNTLKLIRRIFHLCTNKKISSKPCFQYHLGRCPGVCLGKVSLTEYRRILEQVEQFLNHKQSFVVKNLRLEMKEAAQKQRFEGAATIRDKLRSLENIWQKQKIISTKKTSQDYFSLYARDDKSIINLFLVREGRLIHQEFFEIDRTQTAKAETVMESFLEQYYRDATWLPKEIIIRYRIPDQRLLEKWLRIKISIPFRGKKIQLLKLGEENAQDYYEKTLANLEIVLGRLETLLNLPTLPRRIEAYDISNIQGFLPVGSMVVFMNGQPDKSQYRKFRINIKQIPDDVAMMKEMLERRFKHANRYLPLMRGRVRGGHSRLKSTMTSPTPPHEEGKTQIWQIPDLIIIDGGKGQLNAALQVLQATSYKLIPAIGLAKRLEEIYIPGKKTPIRLPEDSSVLHLLQRIRDEAHRFAITFYRSRHIKEQVRSRLDEIPGVGRATKKRLMEKFGSIAAIRNASFEALGKLIGVSLAKKVKEML